MLQSVASLNAKTPSPKPSISSSRQKLAQSDVPIDTLISWLVAAKRSLSSIHHVHRATTILGESRTTIEITTALIARTKYLRRSLNSQLKILRSVQYELEASAHNVKQEINASIRQLERSHDELHKNVSLLQQTRVEDGFRAPSTSYQDAEEKKTLHDFVDDKPVLEIAASINAAKLSVQEAQSTIDQSIRTLEDDLQAINEVLADRTATSSATKSDLQVANIPRSLHSLEDNARDMAQSLEMLVSHFDLCVTAIKNTQGGGAAVAQNVAPDDLPEGVDVHAFEAPAQSMTWDERSEMLKVLRNDAAEVDEVVLELQERGSEMELILERIYNWRETSESSYRDVSHAFQRLEQVAHRLPAHLAETNDFAARCSHEKANLEDIIVGVDQLCDVYDNFLSAYDGMIVEAARRRSVRKRMDKIVQDAQTQLDQLYDDDLNERDIFRSEQGDFLPSDIWYGLSSTPAKFAFQKVSDDGFDSVPDLPKEIVASALRRLKAAQGLQES